MEKTFAEKFTAILEFQSPHKRGGSFNQNAEIQLCQTLVGFNPLISGAVHSIAIDTVRSDDPEIVFQSPHKRGGSFNNYCRFCCFSPKNPSFNPLISGAVHSIILETLLKMEGFFLFQSPHKRGGSFNIARIIYSNCFNTL